MVLICSSSGSSLSDSSSIHTIFMSQVEKLKSDVFTPISPYQLSRCSTSLRQSHLQSAQSRSQHFYVVGSRIRCCHFSPLTRCAYHHQRVYERSGIVVSRGWSGRNFGWDGSWDTNTAACHSCSHYPATQCISTTSGIPFICASWTILDMNMNHCIKDKRDARWYQPYLLISNLFFNTSEIPDKTSTHTSNASLHILPSVSVIFYHPRRG
jgi:hypothetical protein